MLELSAGASATVSVRLTWMSAGDTESTGCENVIVRNTCGWPVADALAPSANAGAANHPLGLLAWHRSLSTIMMHHRCIDA
jgi:hypothetical protein